ncbi:MAG: YncE family protein [Acidobacteriota bacterium]|nr:YncE family protein [Acidobacteriota bacterium]
MRFLLLFLAPAALCAADPALAIVEKASGHVVFFDLQGRELKEVAVGAHPHEMAFSPDGKYLFTSDNGVMVMTEKAQGENTVSIVDIPRETKAGVIDLGPHRRPHGIDFDPSTGHVLVTTELPSALLILDPVKRAVLDVYDIRGRAPHMVRLAPDHRTAFVTCTDTSTLSIVDLKTRNVISLPVGARPQGIVFSPDYKRAYIANSDGHTITVADVPGKKIVGDIPVGGPHSGPVRVAISPDGKTAIAALQLDHAISFAGTATMKEEKTIPLPGSPVSMTLSADGKTAYTAIQDRDEVFEISIASRSILRSFKTPPHSGPDPVMPLPK